MDWELAIERNREALKRILAMLIAMAGLSGLPGRGDAAIAGDRPSTLPRHLHRFVLRLLRPAEAAARRLVIIAAQGLAVEIIPPRIAKPKPRSIFVRNGIGTGIVRKGSLPDRPPARTLPLPLLDPLKRFGMRRRYVPASALPRIRSFDDPRVPLFERPQEPPRLPPSPDDPLDAGRVHRRLAAIDRVLDDLPRAAKRLARWQARRDAATVRDRECEAEQAGVSRRPSQMTGAKTKARPLRLSPMRPGRPPGWRRRPSHAVDEILNELHGLAVWARERTDTS